VAIFVINEWLPEDSSGVNGVQAQRDAFELLAMLVRSNHQIVVLDGTSFVDKFWKLCKSSNIAVTGIVKLYHLSLRQNLDRCRTLKPEEVAAIPPHLANETNADDHYLLETQLAVPGAILVTTDGALREAVIRAGYPCLLREDFLDQYLRN